MDYELNNLKYENVFLLILSPVFYIRQPKSNKTILVLNNHHSLCQKLDNSLEAQVHQK